MDNEMRVKVLTVEAIRKWLPRLDENKLIATPLSAYVFGQQIYNNTERNGIRYHRDNVTFVQMVGMGQGWWDAMLANGVPEWITHIGSLKGCLLDMTHEAQKSVAEKAVSLIKDNGLNLEECTVIARGLYFYLAWGMDSDDIMKLMHEDSNAIQDSWYEDERIQKLELM